MRGPGLYPESLEKEVDSEGEMMKTLPIAIENFSDMIRKDCCYVDKTSFIKTVMEAGSKVHSSRGLVGLVKRVSWKR